MKIVPRHRALVTNERGSGHAFEWGGVAVVALSVVLAADWFGGGVRLRLTGEEHGVAIAALNGVAQTPGGRPDARVNLGAMTREGADPTDARVLAPETKLSVRTGTECANVSLSTLSGTLGLPAPAIVDEMVLPGSGFVNGAAIRFRANEGGGDVFGDLAGVRDQDLVRLLQNPRQSLGDLARGTRDAAPGMLAAVPGALGRAKDGTVAWFSQDVTQMGSQTADFVVMDSLRALGTHGSDAWHGGGVMAEAVWTGDCGKFGATLRSGVNNTPEVTLLLLDAVPLAFGAGKALKGFLVSGKIARAVNMATRFGVRALHAAAEHGATTAGRVARRADNIGRVLGEHATPKVIAGAASRAFSASGVYEAASHVLAAFVPPVLRDGVTSGVATVARSIDGMSRKLFGRPSVLAGIVMCFTAGTEVHTARGLVAIENVRLGDRVLTLGGKQNASTEVNAGWRRVELEMDDERSADGKIRMALLRPSRWVEETGARVGSEVDLSLAEMGAEGKARVLSIAGAPRIRAGRGRVVLSTMQSASAAVLVLRFENSNEVLEPTAGHRLFLIDRSAWVRADALRVGERLRTRNGEAVIASIARKPGTHRVYNLEVEEDHNYLVSQLGVLSHNDVPCAQPVPKAWVDRELRALGRLRDIGLTDELRFMIERGGHRLDDDVLGPFVRSAREMREAGFGDGTYVRAVEDGVDVANTPVLNRYHAARQRLLDVHDALDNTDFGPEWTQDFPFIPPFLKPGAQQRIAKLPVLVRALKELQTPVPGKRFAIPLERLAPSERRRIEAMAEEAGHVGERWRFEPIAPRAHSGLGGETDPVLMTIRLRATRKRNIPNSVDDVAHEMGHALESERQLARGWSHRYLGLGAEQQGIIQEGAADFLSFRAFRQWYPRIGDIDLPHWKARGDAYRSYLMHRDKHRAYEEFGRIYLEEGGEAAAHGYDAHWRIDQIFAEARMANDQEVAAQALASQARPRPVVTLPPDGSTVSFPGVPAREASALRARIPTQESTREEIATFRDAVADAYRRAWGDRAPDVAGYAPGSSYADPRAAFVARWMQERIAREGEAASGVVAARITVRERRGVDIGWTPADVSGRVHADTARYLVGYHTLSQGQAARGASTIDRLRAEAGAIWDEAHGTHARTGSAMPMSSPDLTAPPGQPLATSGPRAMHRELSAERYVFERSHGSQDEQWYLRDVETNRLFVFRRSDPSDSLNTRSTQMGSVAERELYRRPPAAAFVAERFHVSAPPAWIARWNGNRGSLEEVFEGASARTGANAMPRASEHDIQALEYVTGAVHYSDRASAHPVVTGRPQWIPGEIDQAFPASWRRYPDLWEDHLDVPRVMLPRQVTASFRDDLVRFVNEADEIDRGLAPYLNREERAQTLNRARVMLRLVEAGDIDVVASTP